MNIVFLDSHALNPGDLSFTPIQALGTLTCYPRTAPAEVVERAREADALIINKVRLGEDEFRQLPRLRLIQVAATGYDVVDVEAARRHGIAVCNVPSYSTLLVAQHTLALILAACNHVEHYAELCREGYWSSSPDFCRWDRPVLELSGMSIAIVGFGSIGSKLAQLLQPLEAEVLAVSSKPQDSLPQGVRRVSMEEAFRTAHIVSLHCPATSQNRGFVNAALLATARKGLMLINAARGALINDNDVAAALHSGQLACYCADVLSQEPPSADNPLLHAPGVYLTPHIAWSSFNTRTRLVSIMADNLRAFAEGHFQNVVN